MKDCQPLAVTPNDPDTPMTAKDGQQHPVTGNNYMETRLKCDSTRVNQFLLSESAL